MIAKQTIGKEFLASILNSINKEDRIEGFAIMWLEEIIEISHLNDFGDLFEEALAIRNSDKRFGDPLAGAITNIISAWKPSAYKWPKDRAELEKKYSFDHVLRHFPQGEQSSKPSLLTRRPEDVDKAMELARDDYDLATIASSLAIYGHFEAAQKIMENELLAFDFRVNTLKIVMCIELFRRGSCLK
ncbi:MAG: hypothetical protein AB8F95_22545 [Bacteroidia bacterium]